MILTEKEAQGKFCPISFASGTGQMEGCFASECAMWRWYDPATKQEVTATIPQIKEEFGVNADRAEVRQVPFLDRTGYCGLAGRPDA